MTTKKVISQNGTHLIPNSSLKCWKKGVINLRMQLKAANKEVEIKLFNEIPVHLLW